MLYLFRNIHRSLALFDTRFRRRIVITALASAAVGLLDLVGILLLVPFLSYVGGGAPTASRTVSFVQHDLGVSNAENAVLLLALLATALFVVKGIAAVALIWVQSGQILQAQSGLSLRVASAYARAPWLVQQESTTGALVRTSIDSVQSVALVVTAATGGIAEFAVLVAVFGALVVVDPILALSATAYLVVSGALYLRVVRRTMHARGVEVQQEVETRNSALIELVGGAKELRVRGTSAVYLERFGSACRGYLRAYRLINVINLSMRYLLESLMIIGVAIVIVVATLTGSAQTALVSIGILLAGGLRLVPALNALLISVNTVRTQSPAIRIVEDELHRLQDEIPSDKGVGQSADVRPIGAFSLHNVTFRYPTRERPALSEITVSVERGEALGVVGATGSGKSTLVDLLLGLLEPDCGEVLVDGRPLAGNAQDWRAHVGFVPQDIFLIDDTLDSNIRLGLPDDVSSAERMHRAVAASHLDAVVSALPDGLDTTLGERGVRLSGGQRQRVGLARALYMQPVVLILDEATSALDNETEHAITSALHALHGELTMVVIAHRLSTVRECDRILYLDDGKVSGYGTFDQLVQTNSGFARLVELGSLKGTF
jgi:ABC-type multidrug transport system fused ATPase/permease subunit